MQQHNLPPGAIPAQPNYWRFALLFLLPLLIIAAIIFGVFRAVNDGTATYAQADALFYDSNGHLVMATVVTHESGATETYIDNARYAEAIDLENGKRLWRVKLDAQNNRDQDFGEAALLGQSARYLFFLRNELYVIDKKSGVLVARNDHFEAIKDKMSKEEISSYSDSRIKYAYNDSLQALLFKGTDGLLYGINGLTLKAGVINLNDAERYFKRQNQPSYDGLIIQAYDDGKQAWALLDEQEIQLLQTNNLSDEVQHRVSAKSVRRSAYSHPADRSSGDWKKINDAVYIYGGFLTDPHQLYKQPVDSISRNETYKLFAKSYLNKLYAPIRLNSGAVIIAHKVSTENNAPVLLTAVLPDGKVIWRANTGYADLGLLYKYSGRNTLFLMGTPAGKYRYPLQQMLCINLADGNLRSFPIE